MTLDFSAGVGFLSNDADFIPFLADPQEKSANQNEFSMTDSTIPHPEQEFPEESTTLFRSAISQLGSQKNLEPLLMHALVQRMMTGDFREELAAELLTKLYEKGEAVGELVGAARAMREFMTPIRSRRTNVIDTCGTGGGGTNTFNISTAVAIVAAAAGANVAKHGNKKSTGRSGSSDVLEVLGVNLQAPVECVEACLDELGICFCFAPLFHPSVRRITGVRQRLSFPTIFNLLGPLCNPANAPFQLLGAGRGATQSLLAGALQELGTVKAWVVHGEPGLGELSISGTSRIDEVTAEGVRRIELNAETFGFARVPLEKLVVQSPEESALLIREVLNNVPSPHRDIVVFNAAAALQVVGLAPDFGIGIKLAQDSLASGKARDLLEQLAAFTRESV